MWARMRSFLEMIRFSHTVFALPFALTSALLAWQAPGSFQWISLAGILLCMVFARSFAMAVNRLADATFDAANPRTAARHIPSGKLSKASVLGFAVACGAAFVACTFLFRLAEPPNPWPSWLAAPVLVFLALYSYTKRFTILCHFWLGACLLLAPVAAWIAIRGVEEMTVPLLVGSVVFFWVSGFDILYACQDVDFDRKARLSSVPAKLGVPLALRVAMLCHIVMLAILFILYIVSAPPLGAIYLTGVSVVALLLCYEHWLVRPDDLTRVNQAFLHVNGVISIGLMVTIAVQLLVNR